MNEQRESARDGAAVAAVINGQTWHVAWHPPPEPPPGTPHGAEALCLADDRVVVVSGDGRHWGLPAGRPEQHEQWAGTMRREVREEACAAVTGCRLLGFSRGVCVRGSQEGLVLVRSMWRAEVQLEPWEPQFEMSHRRLLPARQAFRSLTVPGGLVPFYRRLFAEAGVPTS
ncbi:NUDIX hydrolase [Streptomyces sp. WMMB 322]|uniref:NUDIX hydrolase n=1 Tax=Streptomyces sp. WMMB 322 TaxID=1286821 RepID=UPI0006E24316|nr:NUDIX domain-containing protein [Streptomyces sp. WMMB 322]SCK23486.1 NUDIX domain-containing protein [Streptomyces sp. WMMB 322]